MDLFPLRVHSSSNRTDDCIRNGAPCNNNNTRSHKNETKKNTLETKRLQSADLFFFFVLTCCSNCRFNESNDRALQATEYKATDMLTHTHTMDHIASSIRLLNMKMKGGQKFSTLSIQSNGSSVFQVTKF